MKGQTQNSKPKTPMTKIQFLFISILFASIAQQPMFSQNTLTITINGLKNSGQVLLEFSNANGEKISGFAQPISNKQCIITIKDLKPGNYTYKCFHDENKNQKLDTNFMGIPKEGFGFANNAKGKFGPPALEKTIINVKGDTSQTCTVMYL
jgi:uncharacterized protein (DUF2141 family)